MKTISIISKLFLVVLVFSLSSCSIFFQQMNITAKCKDEKAGVAVNGIYTDDEGKIKILRRSPLAITAYRYGHRSSSTYYAPKKFNFGVPLTAATTIGFGAALGDASSMIAAAGIFTTLDLAMGIKRQARKFEIPAPVKLPENTEKDFVVYASDKLRNVKPGKMFFSTVPKKKFISKFDDNRSKYISGEGKSSDEWNLEEWFDTKLEVMGYQEDRPYVLPPYEKTLQINLKVDEVVNVNNARGHIFSELDMTFIAEDFFGNELLTYKKKVRSQVFMSSYYGLDYDESIFDAILAGLMEFVSSSEFASLKQSVLARYEIAHKDDSEVVLANDKNAKRNAVNAADAQVTIKRDGYHGSGCVISSDGYILTSGRVVKREESNSVIFSNGKTKKADIIKINPLLNIALLKVDTVGVGYLPIAKNRSYKVGDDVIAYGTPVDEALSQTRTKGIVSAERRENGVNFIQSDVKISQGGNGSPIINTNGDLIGVVNDKYLAGGLNGLTFAVSSEDIVRLLNLKFKD